jgi:hypothetical protein
VNLEGTSRGHGNAAHRTRVAVDAAEMLGLHVVARVAARQMAEQAAQLTHPFPGGGVARYILVQVSRACNKFFLSGHYFRLVRCGAAMCYII